MIIDNDGPHGPFAAPGNVDMATGFHAIRVEFFENEGGATLFVDWAGPGIANQAVPASCYFTD
jgi:hypothetical protein